MIAQKMSAMSIVHEYCKGRMSGRPEYYSGRGVNRGDLNGDLIKMIFDGVLAELGDDPAAAFVDMVEVLKDMSATGFLQSLYRLERNGWVFKASLFNRGDEGVSATDEITAFCTVASMFGRSRSPEGESWEGASIKNSFLAQVGRQQVRPKSKSIWSEEGDSYYINSYGFRQRNDDYDFEDGVEKRVSQRKKLRSKDKILSGQHTAYFVQIFGNAHYAGPFRSRRRANRFIRSDSNLDEITGINVISGPSRWKWGQQSLSKRLY